MTKGKVGSWIGMVMFVTAVLSCGNDEEESAEVTLRAAFAPISRIVVRNTTGAVVLAETGRTLRLAAGVYYLDIRDDIGNSVFDSAGNLNFAVTSDEAELVLEPVEVEGSDVPLVRLIVGEHSHDHDHSIGEHEAAIHTFSSTASARSRVIWEAARAMVGPSLASGISWVESSRHGQYNYIPEDPGAWTALRAAYAGDESCLPVPDPGVACHISIGPADPSAYSCQGACPSPPPTPTVPPAPPAFRYRGGQCKASINLVLYRSGIYHQPGSWNFRKLPSDGSITSPLVTTSSLAAGDVLRRTTGSPHAALVVRKISPTRVVVYDSNWVGGGGYEYIGTHIMEIYTSGSANGTIQDLDTYRDLDCVYNSSPC